jgi:macrolide transport system ATP-binding/permease protein
VRTLRRQPGLVASATLFAGLGIGVCTVVFGIVNLALFQPLPVHEPKRLLAIGSHSEQQTNNPLVSLSELRAIEEAHSWEGVAGYVPVVPGEIGPSGGVKPAWGSIVSGNYGDIVKPTFSLGQGFVTGEDDIEGGAPKVILSHAIWLERYGADSALLGKDIFVNGRPMMLAGVTSPRFKGTTSGLVVNFYLPLSQASELFLATNQGNRTIDNDMPVFGLGRLRLGIAPTEARAELAVVSAGLVAEFPDRGPERGFDIEPAGQVPRGLVVQMRPTFLLLLTVAVLVLLTACANVANLLLARASMRGPELSTRLALGAGRQRMVRQLLTESVLLASAGGILGVGFAAWAGGLGGKLTLPVPIPTDATLPTDYRTVAIAVLLCFASGIVFGLMPALRSAKIGVFDGLRSNSGASAAGFRRFGLRNSLAAAQIAMLTVLLVCSAVSINSFGSVGDSLVGEIDPAGISVIGFNPAMSGYDATTGKDLLQRIVGEAETIPGILSVSISDSVPMARGGSVASEPLADDDEGENTRVASVTPRDFETIGIRVVDGEPFKRSATNEATVIIDEGLAEALFPEGGPQSGLPYSTGRTNRPGLSESLSAPPNILDQDLTLR